MVLFTSQNKEQTASVEQSIQENKMGIQKLLEQCRNRYHILNTYGKGSGGKSHVQQVIEKVEEMVAMNDGQCFKLDQKQLALVHEMQLKSQRKKQRWMEGKKQSERLKSLISGDKFTPVEEGKKYITPQAVSHFPELRMVLLGEREAGKSSAGNTILRKLAFKTGQVTEDCASGYSLVAQRWLTVVDTPGWDSGPSEHTTERVQNEIQDSVSLLHPGPHAFLLVVAIDADVQVSAVRRPMEFLGEAVWRHTLVLFTNVDKLRNDVTIKDHIERSEQTLWLVKQCRNQYHVIDNTCQDNETQVIQLIKKVDALVAANCGEPFSSLLQNIIRGEDMSEKKGRHLTAELETIEVENRQKEEQIKQKHEQMEKEIEDLNYMYEEKIRDRDTEMTSLIQLKENIISELRKKNEELQGILAETQENYTVSQNKIMALQKDLLRNQKELEDTKTTSDKYRTEIEKLQVEGEKRETEIRKLMLVHEEQVRKQEEDNMSKIQELKLDINMLKEKNQKEQRDYEALHEAVKERDKEMVRIRECFEEKEKMRQAQLELMTKEKESLIEEQRQKYEKHLKDERETAKEALEMKEKEIANLLEQAKEYHIKAEKTEQTLKAEMKLRISEVEDKLKKTTKMYNDSQSEVEELKKSIKKEKTAYKQLMEKYEMTVKDMNMLKQKYEEMESHTEAMKADRNQLKKNLQGTEVEIKNLKEKLNMRHLDVDSLRHKYEEKQRQIAVKLETLEVEKRQKEEQMKQKHEEMEKEIEDLKYMYEEKIRNRDIEITSLIELKENIISELREKNEELQGILAETQENYTVSQNKIMALQKDLLRNQKELEDTKKTSDKYRTEIEKLQVEGEKRETEIRKLMLVHEEQVRKQEEDNMSKIPELKLDIRMLKEKNKKQQQDNEALHEAVKERDKEMVRIRECFEEKEKMRQAQLELMTKEKESLIEEQRQKYEKHLKDERETAKEALGMKEKEIANLLEQAKEYHIKAEKMEQTLKAEMKLRISDVEDKLKKTTKMYNDSESDVEELKQRIEKEMSANKQLIEKYEMTVKDMNMLKQKYEEMESHTEAMKADSIQLKKNLQGTEVEIKNLKEKLNARHLDVDSLRHKYEEKQRQIAVKLETLEVENRQKEEQMKQKHEQMEKEIEDLKYMYEEKIRNRDTEMTSLIQLKENIISELRKKNEELQGILAETQENYTVSQNKIMALQKDLLRNMKELEDTKKTSDKYRTEIEKLQVEGEKRETEIRKLMLVHEEQMRKQEDNKSKIQELKLDIKMLKEKNQKEQRDNEALHEAVKERDKEMVKIRECFEEKEKMRQAQVELMTKEKESLIEEQRQKYEKHLKDEKETAKEALEMKEKEIANLLEQAKEYHIKAEKMEQMLKAESKLRISDVEDKLKETTKMYNDSQSEVEELKQMTETEKTAYKQLMEKLEMNVLRENYEDKEYYTKEMSYEKYLNDEKEAIKQIEMKEKEVENLLHQAKGNKEHALKVEDKLRETTKMYNDSQSEVEELKRRIEKEKTAYKQLMEKYEMTVKDMSVLKQKYEEMESHTEAMKADRSQLKKNLQGTEVEINLKEKLNARHLDVDNLRRKYEEKQRQIAVKLETLEVENRQKEEQMKQKHEQMEKEIEDLKYMYEEKIRNRDTEMTSLIQLKENIISELRKKNEELQGILAETQENYTVSQNKIMALQKDLLRNQKELEDTKTTSDKYRTEIEKLQAEGEKRETEIRKIMLDHEEQMRKQEDNMSKIQELKLDIKMLKEKNQKEQRDNEALHEAVKERDKEMVKIRECFEEKEKMRQAQVELMTKEKESLIEEQRQKYEKHLKDEKETAKEALEMKEKEIANLLEQAKEYHIKAEKMEQTLKAEMKLRISDVEDKLKETTKMYNDSQSEVEELKQRTETEKTAYKQLMKKLEMNVLRKNYEDKEYYTEERSYEKETIKQMLEMKEKEVENLLQAKGSKEHSLKVEDKLKETTKMYNDSESEVEELKKMIEKEKIANKQLMEKYEMTVKDMNVLKQKYEEMESHTEAMKADRSQLQENLQGTEVEINLKQKLNARHLDVDNLRHKYEEKERQIAVKLETLEVEKRQKEEQMKQKHEHMEKEIEDLKYMYEEKIRNRDTEMTSLIQLKENIISELREKNEELQGILADTQGNYNVSQNKIMELQEHLLKNKKQLEMCDYYRAEIERYKIWHEKTGMDKVPQLNLENKTNPTEFDLDIKMNETQEMEIEVLDQAMKEKDHEIARIRQHCEELKTKIQNINDELKEISKMYVDSKVYLERPKEMTGCKHKKDFLIDISEIFDTTAKEINILKKQLEKMEADRREWKHERRQLEREIQVSVEEIQNLKQQTNGKNLEVKNVPHLSEQRERGAAAILHITQVEKIDLKEETNNYDHMEKETEETNDKSDEEKKSINEDLACPLISNENVFSSQKGMEAEDPRMSEKLSSEAEEYEKRTENLEHKLQAELKKKEELQMYISEVEKASEDKTTMFSGSRIEVIRLKEKIGTLQNENKNKLAVKEMHEIQKSGTEQEMQDPVKDINELKKKVNEENFEGHNFKDIKRRNDRSDRQTALTVNPMKEKKIEWKEEKRKRRERRQQKTAREYDGTCLQEREKQTNLKVVERTELQVIKQPHGRTMFKNEPPEVTSEPSLAKTPRFIAGISKPSELRLVLLGESWSHRTSVGSTILERTAGHTLHEEMESHATKPLARQGVVAGRQVTMVEMLGQGWYHGPVLTHGTQSQVEVSVSLCSPGPHAFLLVVPVYLTFTAHYWKVVQHHMSILGDGVWKHTMVLFTWGHTLGETIQQHIVRWRDLRRLVKKCGNRYHILRGDAEDSHVTELLEKVEKMVAENGGHHYDPKNNSEATKMPPEDQQIDGPSGGGCCTSMPRPKRFSVNLETNVEGCCTVPQIVNKKKGPPQKEAAGQESDKKEIERLRKEIVEKEQGMEKLRESCKEKERQIEKLRGILKSLSDMAPVFTDRVEDLSQHFEDTNREVEGYMTIMNDLHGFSAESTKELRQWEEEQEIEEETCYPQRVGERPQCSATLPCSLL
uniref:AIG1-type G domain-containing protein n=2 Tax=Scleropages formosus TaxID=113540 RepID=A0A8D0CH62_SCLFO